MVLGDDAEGYIPEAPYDKVCVTACYPRIPPSLIPQLKPYGKLVVPVGPPQTTQSLTLLEKYKPSELKTRVLEYVLYIPLVGKYGWRNPLF